MTKELETMEFTAELYRYSCTNHNVALCDLQVREFTASLYSNFFYDRMNNEHLCTKY